MRTIKLTDGEYNALRTMIRWEADHIALSKGQKEPQDPAWNRKINTLMEKFI